MQTYEKIAKLADKFDATYPKELPARLEWWGKSLGIDRPRLLRMIGLSPQQAARKKGEALAQILKEPKWEKNARVMEGGLLRLLSLFHYDWHALAARVHQPVRAAATEEPLHVVRRKGAVSSLRYAPNGATGDLVINRMVESGPQALSALIECLVES